MIEIDSDRRRFPRVSLSRRCKVYEPRSRRYIAGTTCNVAPGGLLIRLDRAASFESGDRIYIALQSKLRRGLLSRDDFVAASIARATGVSSGETYLGVLLDDAADLPVMRAAA